MPLTYAIRQRLLLLDRLRPQAQACHRGLAWAWGAWCGAATAQHPHWIWLLLLLHGLWWWREQNRWLLSVWCLLLLLRGALLSQSPPDVHWSQGVAWLSPVAESQETACRLQGTLILSVWEEQPVQVRIHHPMPAGLYQIVRNSDVSHSLCELHLLQLSGEWRERGKGWWRTQLEQAMGAGRPAQLFAAMSTGQIEDPSLRSLLGRFGMSHLLALSGLHVGLVMAAISQLLTHLGFWGRSLLIVKMASLLGYLFAVGPFASVLRAGGMSLMQLWGEWLGRRSSALHGLGCVMSALLLWDPGLCQSLGFQLSCAATFGLLAWSRPLGHILLHAIGHQPEGSPSRGKKLEGARSTPLFLQVASTVVATNLSVLPLTVPILLWRFHEVNFLGLWVNALYAPLLAWSFSLSLIIPWTGVVGRWLGAALHLSTEFLLDLLQMPWWWDLWSPPVEIDWPLAVFLTWCVGSGVYLLLSHDQDARDTPLPASWSESLFSR